MLAIHSERSSAYCRVVKQWPKRRRPVNRNSPGFLPAAFGATSSTLTATTSQPRSLLVLEWQTPDAIDRIHRAIREGAERFTRDGTYEMAWPAVLAAARKPLS